MKDEHPRAEREKAGLVPGKKVYCSHWIRTGECDFLQQGCLYKHEMPDDATLKAIGIRVLPVWYIAAHPEKARERGFGRGSGASLASGEVGHAHLQQHLPDPFERALMLSLPLSAHRRPLPSLRRPTRPFSVLRPVFRRTSLDLRSVRTMNSTDPIRAFKSSQIINTSSGKPDLKPMLVSSRLCDGHTDLQATRPFLSSSQLPSQLQLLLQSCLTQSLRQFGNHVSLNCPMDLPLARKSLD